MDTDYSSGEDGLVELFLFLCSVFMGGYSDSNDGLAEPYFSL